MRPVAETASRLLVVSNRLPVTIKEVENAAGEKEWKFSGSSGGLVSALSGVKKQMPFLWIGWPGREWGPGGVVHTACRL